MVSAIRAIITITGEGVEQGRRSWLPLVGHRRKPSPDGTPAAKDAGIPGRLTRTPL
jgi:hypothetical protein